MRQAEKQDIRTEIGSEVKRILNRMNRSIHRVRRREMLGRYEQIDRVTVQFESLEFSHQPAAFGAIKLTRPGSGLSCGKSPRSKPGFGWSAEIVTEGTFTSRSVRASGSA